MYLPNNGRQQTDAEATDIYTFRREEGQWYIDLPVYLSHGWTRQDLQMTEGAHKFLNRLAGGAQKLRLRLRTLPWEGSHTLELVEHCEAPSGGAIYLYRKDKGQSEGELFWICDLALFVFGDMPERIYVQRLPGKAGQRATQKNGEPLLKERERIYPFTAYRASFQHQTK